MTDKKTFGLFIKSKRIEKNYSQKDLAEQLYVTESAVSKWERGVSFPDVTLIADICRALDVSEHELITASTDTNSRRLQNEARLYRRIRGAWFWVSTISYLIALLVCFICNLAIDHTLSWFFVVLAAIVCAYSFVPTFTSFFAAKKLLVFIVTTLASVCLLLMTCAIYTSSVFWVPTACFGVLIGYALIFLPVLITKYDCPKPIKSFRMAIPFVSAFVLTILLLLVTDIWHPFMLKAAILLTCYCFVPVVVCAVLCGFRFSAFLKAGVCIVICAIPFYFVNPVIEKLFGVPSDYSYNVDLSDWINHTNGNICFIIALTALALSIVFIALGIYTSCRQKRK